jgi:hypothetical protein
MTSTLSSGLLQEVLALAGADPFSTILGMVDPHKAAMVEVQAAAVKQAAKAYQDAGQAFAQHLAAVIKSNPGKTFEEIMGRPDVQGVLHGTLGQAYDQAKARITAAYSAGAKLGHGHAAKEAKVLGTAIAKYIETGVPGEYVGKLLDDLDKTANAAATGFIARAQAGFAGAAVPKSVAEGGKAVNVPVAHAKARAEAIVAELEAESKALARRAGAGASVAVTRGYNDAKHQAYQQVSHNLGKPVAKVWVCNFGPNTCATCAALHGTIVGLNDSFPTNVTFAAGKPPKVYFDLRTPPRHPHCRCVLVPYIPGPGADTAIAQMKSYALQVAKSKKGMAPRSFPLDTISDVARTTDMVMASDIRAINEVQFRASVDFFRSCVIAKMAKVL